jgi:hypothetical protein
MDLEPGEHLIFEGHPSWRSILGFYAKGLVVVAIAGALAAAATRIADGEVDGGLVTIVVLVALAVVLAIGNVNFDTAAGDDFDFEFGGVASPQEVVEAVHRAQREADATAPARG